MNGLFLEEVPGQEAEGEGADALLHNLARVGVDPVRRGAEEKSGALLELSLGGGLVNAPALGRQGLIEFLHRDGTGGDVDDPAARAGREESDGKVVSGAGLLEVRSDLGAVVPGSGRGNELVDGVLEPRHVVQEIRHLPALPAQLLLVFEVLILAAPAAGKERAAGLDPVRAGGEDLQEIGLGAIGLVFPDPHPDPLAGEGEGDENDPSPVARRAR